MADYPCLVCGEQRLSPLDAYARLPRVTSDCKPWPAGGKLAVCLKCGTIQKLPDAAWLEEIGRIYKGYTIYYQSSGAEQAVFSPEGQATPRSKALARYVVDKIDGKRPGKLFDFGCGNGAALASFSALLKGWSFYGSELSDGVLPRLKQIPGFQELFTVPPSRIHEAFDIVSMIHSLEHLPDPRGSLRDIAALLTKDGKLFLEVPDAENSLFDILTADHLVHFTQDTLRFILAKAGIETLDLSTSIVSKEISLLGAPKDGVVPRPPAPERGMALARRNMDWLSVLLKAADQAASATTNFGLFGTSISSMWLYGALGKKVAFFVDEDTSRTGSSIEGRPILAPAQVQPNAVVYMPLVPKVAASVAARLCALSVRFVLPPALEVFE